MNTTRFEELLLAYEDNALTPDELAEFKQLLGSAPAARQRLVEAGVLQTIAASHVMAKAVIVPPQRKVIAWLQWRPLAAAAAGLVIGLFSASVVFGFVAQRGLEKRTPLAVFEPGFEDAQMPLTIGFPGGPGQWSGDAAQVVAAENGVPPKEGKFMLRLEPMSRGVPRIYQVLDLQSLPSGAGTETRDMEISASFAAADPETAVRYVIRAFAVTEAPETLDVSWFDRREESIASVARGMDFMPGATGWQTFSVRMQVPRAARSLVLFFGARTPDRASRMSPHYLDDVRASLLASPALP